MSEYELGDIIIFRDHRSSKPVDESGCNQVAVVIDDKRALFTRECVTVLRKSDVHRLDNAKHISLVFPEVRNEVSSFFRRHMYSRGYVDAGLSALSNLNIMPFLTGFRLVIADHALGLPVLRTLSLSTCRRQYPGAAAGRILRSSHPAISAFPDMAVGSACTSSFSRLAQRSLALRPAHSRCHQFVTR